MASVAFDPLIPVLYRYAKGFPEHADGEPATYGPFSEAATTAFNWDAHFCAASCSTIERRLAGQAALGYEPTMVLFVVDVDGPDHTCTPQWWAAEREKIQRLFKVKGWGYAYTTRGGYRICYGLRDELTLRTPQDAARWRESYLEWIAVLARDFEIVADEACADWTRLYRLPRVTRDGAPTKPDEEIGWPNKMLAWREPYVAADDPRCVRSAQSITIPKPAPVPGHTDDEREASLEKAASALAAQWPSRARHYSSLALCGALARAGWQDEAIADFVAGVCVIAGADPDVTKRLAQARSSCDKLARGETDVMGLPKLEDYMCTGADGVLDESRRAGVRQAITSAWRALGMGPPIDLFAIVLAPKAMPDHGVRLHLKSERMKIARRADPDAQRDAELMKPCFDGSVRMLAPDELRETAAALVRHAPAGATDQQIANVMAGIVPDADAAAAVIGDIRMAAAPPIPDTATVDGFAIDPQTQRPYASQHNIAVALDKLGVRLRYDQLGLRVVAFVEGTTKIIVSDDHVVDLLLQVDRLFKFRPSKDFFYDVVGNLARQSSYHPVLEYLDGLVWDGVPRIDTWLTSYGGAKDTTFVRAVSRLVLVAGVRRVRQPGCKFDEMLVLESPQQGTNKSSAVQTLCPDPAWFTSDLPLGADTKRLMESTMGKWIVEAGELRGMSRADVRGLKAYLTRQVDESRMAYGRLTTVAPRQFITIGTTNDKSYLKDATGNRRFWPVEVTKFDTSRLAADRDQLWAEASAAEASGESIRLAEELWSDAKAEQSERQVEDPFEVLLAGALGERTGKLRIEHAWRVCRIDRTPTQDEMTRIGTVMNSLGWERKRLRFEGGLKYAYVKGTDVEQMTVLEFDNFGALVARVPKERTP